MLSTGQLAAADELDNFVAVAGRDQRLRPLRAGQNFQVAFDGHATAIETKLAQEIGNVSARLGTARLAIYRNGDGGIHRFILPPEL